MGLDLSCNGVLAKCGSYKNVQVIRRKLLEGLKFYIEMEYHAEKDTVEYIISLFSKTKEICYQNFSQQGNQRLSELGLDGFIPFIYHNDNMGYLSSHEAKEFMQTWEITKEYMDTTLKDYERKFYLEYIFKESIRSGENIHFF